MQTVIRTIGLLSLTGGITFLLFCFLRLALKQKVSARWQSQALLLLTLFWIVPAGSFYPRNSTASDSTALQDIVAHHGVGQAAFVTEKAMPMVDVSWLAYGYCVVAVLCLLCFWLQYRRQYHDLLQNSWEITGAAEQALFRGLLHQQQITSTVQLRCSSAISAPILVGLRRYYILLPNRTLQTGQIKLILSHELAHIKYYDNWRKVYLELLRCVYWFCPFIYWLKDVMDDLCELASDEQVVRSLSGMQRKQYGMLLLDMMQQERTAQLGYSGLNQVGRRLRKRLLHIMNYQIHTRLISGLYLFLLCMICLVGCGVSGVIEKQLPGEITDTVKLEITKDGELIEQWPIESFSWEQRTDKERIALLINGKTYEISGLDAKYYVFPQELQHYWEALAQLPEQTLPENLSCYLNTLLLQTRLEAMEWEEPAKPILAFSYEKKPNADRTSLYINGEAYSYEVLDDGNLVISGAVLKQYGETLWRMPAEQMPEDLYMWLRNHGMVSG